MSQIIPILATNAIKAYQNAPKEVKEAIKTLCAPYDLDQDITSIVTGYEAACELYSFNPLTLADFSMFPQEDQDYAFANHQLDMIIKAMNGGFQFDYSNGDQKKWYPIFVWDSNAAGGSGFSLSYVSYNYSNSFVGARRSFKDEKLCRHTVTKFLSIYNRALRPFQS